MVDDVANPIKRQLKLWNPMISGCLSTSDSLLNLWYSHPTTTSCATHWCLVHWTSLTTIDRKQWVFPSEKWEASWKSPFGLVWQRNCLVAIHHFFFAMTKLPFSCSSHVLPLCVYIYNELNSYNILYENINIYIIYIKCIDVHMHIEYIHQRSSWSLRRFFARAQGAGIGCHWTRCPAGAWSIWRPRWETARCEYHPGGSDMVARLVAW